MKILVAEDEFVSRKLMQRMLTTYGDVDVAADGDEALEAFRLAMKEAQPYDLIFLDIVMPGLDGQTVLKGIRKIEEENGIHGADGVKVIMTSAYDDKRNVMEAFRSQCDAYIVKPIDQKKLVEQLTSLGLLK